jgi:hypothetical protein
MGTLVTSLTVALLLIATGGWAQDVKVAVETGGLVIVIPPELLTLDGRLPTPPPTAAGQPDTATPTWVFLGAAAVDWTTGATACQLGCRSRSGSLPNVTDPRIAVPLGLAIDGATIWLCHQVIGPRWPTVAQGLLYGLSIVRGINAHDHVAAQRRRNRGL